MNDCLCCEAALGILDILKEGLRRGGECDSGLEREESDDAAGEMGICFGDAIVVHGLPVEAPGSERCDGVTATSSTLIVQ